MGMMVAQHGRQGDHEVSRKAIAQGTPECFRFTCMLVCAISCTTLHTRPRVQRAPGLPCALCLKREQTKLKPRTKNRVARTKSHAWPILRDARKGALLRMRFSSGEALMVRRREAPSRTMATRYARGPHERSDMRDAVAPDIAEPVIGRAFARPVGSSGLRLRPFLMPCLILLCCIINLPRVILKPPPGNVKCQN